MQGIKEIQDIQAFLVESINATDKSFEDDGEVKGNDIFNYSKAAIKLPEMIIGIGKVGVQWNDIDDNEREILRQGWEGIDLRNEELEVELEGALADLVSWANRMSNIISLIRKESTENGSETTGG